MLLGRGAGGMEEDLISSDVHLGSPEMPLDEDRFVCLPVVMFFGLNEF